MNALNVTPLFSEIDSLLISLLKKLEAQAWTHPTSAGSWTVKDVVSHLLDGNLRTLSIQRDKFFGERPPVSKEYSVMVSWLNELNRSWVDATRRLSPGVLIMLHEITGPMVTAYYESLDPKAEAIFPVQWAGESQSRNWMHLAREYTEKWHHQQQIRETVGDQTLLAPEFYTPYLDTSLKGLPFILKHLKYPMGTSIGINISENEGLYWMAVHEKDGWNVRNQNTGTHEAEVIIPANLAWKLFSRNVRPQEAEGNIILKGDKALGREVLNLVAVMA